MSAAEWIGVEHDDGVAHLTLSRPPVNQFDTELLRGILDAVERLGEETRALVVSSTVEGLFAFAATLPERFDRQFDLLFDATLGDQEIDAFLARHNPEARGAMAKRFDEALSRDLWQPRRNAVPSLVRERLP